MANISSLVSLDSFVNRLLGKEGKDNEDYLRYMQIACDGIKDFHIHDFNIEVTKVITVSSDTSTFAYPSDYVRYTMIGTPIDGRWWSYTREDGMVPLSDDDGTEILSTTTNIAEFKVPTSLSSGGGYNRYYFSEDEANRRIQVGGFTPDVIVLKYITNGIDSGGSINIPMYAQPALEGFVRWQIAEYDSNALSRIDWLERQYVKAKRKMRSAQRPTLQDIIDVLNSGSSQGVSRG